MLESETVAALKDPVINEENMQKINQIINELNIAEEITKAMIGFPRNCQHSR